MDSTKPLHLYWKSLTSFCSLAFSLPSYFSSLHNRIHFYYVFLSSLYRTCSSTRTYVNHRDWVLWLPNIWVQEKYNLDLLWFQLEIWLFPEHWKGSTRLLSILKTLLVVCKYKLTLELFFCFDGVILSSFSWCKLTVSVPFLWHCRLQFHEASNFF